MAGETEGMGECKNVSGVGGGGGGGGGVKLLTTCKIVQKIINIIMYPTVLTHPCQIFETRCWYSEVSDVVPVCS